MVLVTGPWLAGTTSLIDALRERLPEHTFVEADELGTARRPRRGGVRGVRGCSADRIRLCAGRSRGQNTDLVIGVVAKIDAHRNWREVLAADRTQLAACAPRYQHVAVGRGRGCTGSGRATARRTGRRAPAAAGRSRCAASKPACARGKSRLDDGIDRYRADAAGADRQARVTALRKNRDDILRARRLSKTERTIALRSQIQQARVQLAHFARNRCTSVRAELAEDASSMSATQARRVRVVCAYPRGRGRRRGGRGHHQTPRGCRDRTGLVGARTATAAEPAPEFSRPPLKSRRLETQLDDDARCRLRVRRRACRDAAVRGPRAGPDHRGTGGGRSGGPAASRCGWWAFVGCCTTAPCWTAGSPTSPPRCVPRSRSGWLPGCWPPRRR